MAEPSHLLRCIQPLLEASFSRHQERRYEELIRLHDVLRLQGLYRSRANFSLTHEAYERDIEARRRSILKIVKGTVATAEGKPSSEDAQELKAFVSAYLGSHIQESEERLQQQAALWEF